MGENRVHVNKLADSLSMSIENMNAPLRLQIYINIIKNVLTVLIMFFVMYREKNHFSLILSLNV